jgi:hypothetical protein
VVAHLGGERDDVRLSQLGDRLDHGGGGVGRQMGRWVSHGLTEEHSGWELKVLAWCWGRSQRRTRRAATARSGRRILVEAGRPVEPAELVDHPVGGVGPHSDASSIRTDWEDVGRPAKGGNSHPAGVRRECDVLHGAWGVSSVEGVEMVDRGKGRSERMSNNSEEVEVVAELVSGEEKAAAGVPCHCHDCLRMGNKVGNDSLRLRVGDVHVLRLFSTGDIDHVKNGDDTTVYSIEASSVTSWGGWRNCNRT